MSYKEKLKKLKEYDKQVLNTYYDRKTGKELKIWETERDYENHSFEFDQKYTQYKSEVGKESYKEKLNKIYKESVIPKIVEEATRMFYQGFEIFSVKEQLKNKYPQMSVVDINDSVDKAFSDVSGKSESYKERLNSFKEFVPNDLPAEMKGLWKAQYEPRLDLILNRLKKDNESSTINKIKNMGYMQLLRFIDGAQAKGWFGKESYKEGNYKIYADTPEFKNKLVAILQGSSEDDIKKQLKSSKYNVLTNIKIQRESYKERLNSFKEGKGDVTVTYIKDGKRHNKVFENNPDGAAENAKVAARKWIDKHNIDNLQGFELIVESYKERLNSFKEGVIATKTSKGGKYKLELIQEPNGFSINQYVNNSLRGSNYLGDKISLNDAKKKFEDEIKDWKEVNMINLESHNKKESLTLDDVAIQKYKKKFKDLTPEEKKYVNYVYAEWSDEDDMEEGCKGYKEKAISWHDAQKGNNVLVKSKNMMGVITHTYGRKFNVLTLKDGEEKTYDRDELEFFESFKESFWKGMTRDELIDKLVKINMSKDKLKRMSDDNLCVLYDIAERKGELKKESYKERLNSFKEDIFDDRQKKIAIDTVKNPKKALLGGPSVDEAIKILKTQFKYTDDMIKKLQESYKESWAQKYVDDKNQYKKLDWYMMMGNGKEKTINGKDYIVFNKDDSVLKYNDLKSEWEVAKAVRLDGKGDPIFESYKERLSRFKEYNKSGLKQEYDDLFKYKDEMTQSDLQGSVGAIVNKFFKDVSRDDKDGRWTMSQIEDAILEGLSNKLPYNTVDMKIGNIHLRHTLKKVNIQSYKESTIRLVGDIKDVKVLEKIKELCKSYGVTLTEYNTIEFDDKSLLKKEINEFFGELKNLGIDYNIKESFLERLNRFKEDKVYVQDTSEAPEGVSIQTGPRGGKYYMGSPDDKQQPKKQDTPKNSKEPKKDTPRESSKEELVNADIESFKQSYDERDEWTYVSSEVTKEQETMLALLRSRALNKEQFRDFATYVRKNAREEMSLLKEIQLGNYIASEPDIIDDYLRDGNEELKKDDDDQAMFIARGVQYIYQYQKLNKEQIDREIDIGNQHVVRLLINQDLDDEQLRKIYNVIRNRKRDARDII